MSIRTPLARARGLGSAQDGVGHWWLQRLSAAALVPLALWFVVSLVLGTGGGYEAALGWLSAPVPALVMAALIVVGLYHSQLGLQVIVEDYVHLAWAKYLLLAVLQVGNIIIAAAAVLALLWLVLGGAA